MVRMDIATCGRQARSRRLIVINNVYLYIHKVYKHRFTICMPLTDLHYPPSHRSCHLSAISSYRQSTVSFVISRTMTPDTRSSVGAVKYQSVSKQVLLKNTLYVSSYLDSNNRWNNKRLREVLECSMDNSHHTGLSVCSIQPEVYKVWLNPANRIRRVSLRDLFNNLYSGDIKGHWLLRYMLTIIPWLYQDIVHVIMREIYVCIFRPITKPMTFVSSVTCIIHA
jgi:hypothetical protein